MRSRAKNAFLFADVAWTSPLSPRTLHVSFYQVAWSLALGRFSRMVSPWIELAASSRNVVSLVVRATVTVNPRNTPRRKWHFPALSPLGPIYDGSGPEGAEKFG